MANKSFFTASLSIALTSLALGGCGGGGGDSSGGAVAGGSSTPDGTETYSIITPTKLLSTFARAMNHAFLLKGFAQNPRIQLIFSSRLFCQLDFHCCVSAFLHPSAFNFLATTTPCTNGQKKSNVP